MNKIFKVVWSKTKECYVVVSEVAKNNGGKKKVLASVLAGLAMLAAGNANAAVTEYGLGASATGTDATAYGSDAKASGNYSVAVGKNAEATQGNAVAVGRLSKATGTSSVALGVNNKAQADDTTAVGSSNTIAAIATQASAFGRENTINRPGAFAAGYKNTTNGDRNVAVGSENTTTGEDSIGIGTKVIAGTGKTIAIGSVASSDGTYLQTIARGNDTVNPATGQVNNIFALAIGNGAQADGKAKSASGMIAIGQEVKADNNNTIAIGVKTEATGNNGTAVGGYAKAIGTSSAAFGTQAIANGIGATAFGPGASAGTGSGAADGSVAVGRKAAATAAGGVGIGWTASASEKNATAIGFSATASGVQSVAIGGGDEYDYPGTERGKHFTTASGKNSVAVGSYAKATEENAIAFGTDANANIAGGVALGSESKTTTVAGVQGYNPADSRTNKYSDQAGAVGTSTLAAVSVGNGLTATRQITGVAAGTADTDAVNVAQLKNVNLKYAGDTGNSDVLLKDGTLKVKGDTNFISTSADATGITVTAKIGDPITANTDGKAVAPTTNGLATTTNVADAINASGWKVTSLNNGGTTNGTTSEKVSPGDTVTFSAGKNIVLDQAGKQFTYSLSSTLKDIESIQNGASKITLNNAGGTTISGGNLSVDGNKITKVAQGTDGTDAVNVDQLNAVAAKERHVKPGNYAVDGNGTVTLNYVDGNNADVADTAVISGIAKDDLSNITNAGKKVITGLGSKVEAGDNVTVTDTTDATTGQKTYAVSANLTKVTDGTNTTVTGNGTTADPYKVNVAGDLTGITSIANTAGGPTMTIGGNSINVTGGNLDLGSNKITNLAPGTNDTDAVNYKQLKAAKTVVEAGTNVSVNKTLGANGEDVYTVSATAGGTASTESVVKKAAAAGDTNIADVSVAGGKNVNDPGAQYEVSVSKNAVKDAAREAVTVNNGGNTDNPITVTPTDDAANHNTTYAVTFDGDKAAKQIPLTYKANGSGDKTVKLDKGLDFTNGTNTTAEIGNDGVVKFNLKDNVALTNAGSLTVGDTKVNNDGLTISGGPSVTKNGIDAGNQKITNVAPGTISSTSTDAVNGSQLYDVDQKFNNTVKLTGNAGATDGQALNKANGLSFGVIGADNGKYISTSANGSDVTVDLSTDAKKLLNNTVEVKGKNAATVTTSTETTADGGTKTIYTVDVASTGTVAKSSWNIKSSADTANGGAEATGHEAAAKNIADTNTVEMVAGKNLTVKQTSDTDGAKVEYALNKDLKDLTSVTTEKVTTKEIGLQDPTGKVTTIKNDGDRITYTKDGDTKVHKVATLDDEKHIKPGSYAVQNDGSVTMTYVDGNGDPVANDEAKITGIAKQDLSNITDAGKNVITGLGTIVKAGDNVTVSEASDATTGQKTYTVNAVTPAVYTKADGTKVVKRPDGTFTTNVDGAPGNDVPASDVIVSIQDASGNRTGGNSIVNNVGSAIDKTGTSTGDTFLTNLNNAATDNPFAAVNVRDLKSTADALKASELHIAPTSVATGSTEVVGGTASGNTNPGAATQAYKYNATTKQVELTFNDGNGKAVNGPKAVIDFSDLNTGGTAASSWNIKSSANTTDGGAIGDNHDAAAQNIADNKTVEFQAGKNLVVKQTNDAANGNATVEFSLSDNITAGKDGANGKDGSVGATGKDGSSVVLNGKDGSIGMTGPKGQDGKDGINGRDGANISITSAKGEQVLVNRDPAHNGDTDKAERIVYVPKDANGNPIQGADGKNIVREVATMDDGLRFTGNNTSTENKQKLGSLVKVEGEGVTEAQANSFQSATGNIAVVADGADKLTVKLNKDLKGLDSVTTKEVKLGDANDNISIKKAGDRITYTTPGSTDTHKVATLDDEMHIKDTTYTVDGNKKVTMTYVDGNGNPVAGKTAVIDLSGLPVGETDTDMRIKEGTYTAQNGKVTLNTVDKGGNPVTGKDVVIDGINTNNYVAGDNVTLTPDTDAAGKPVVKINAALSTEKVVKKAGADNLATVSTASGNVAGDKGETYEVAVTKGDIENNAEISYKANGGTAQKTTLANGFNFTSDDNSVAITTGANGKVNFKVDTTGIQGKAFNLDVNKEGTGKVENAQTAAATPSVEKGTKFVAGNNLSIRHDAINGDANYDHQVTYALNSDLKGINSITNNGGATMNFGPNEVSITGGNLNMGGSKITNVKNGTDKSDVATVGQLTKVTSNDNTVAINKTTDADGAPVYDLSVQGGGHDPRVDQLGEEIGRVGAQGAALAALKPIQYDPLEPTQIMAGYGNYRGNSAIAMGVAHYKNESTMMHAGLAWAGGSRHMMANAGVTWKVGNRDSEAAVADRYRKGPISSAYAMQQEMASVKAQNAGLKTEVSDLKAENEQMKAQIAAMMAKLGM